MNPNKYQAGVFLLNLHSSKKESEMLRDYAEQERIPPGNCFRGTDAEPTIFKNYSERPAGVGGRKAKLLIYGNEEDFKNNGRLSPTAVADQIRGLGATRWGVVSIMGCTDQRYIQVLKEGLRQNHGIDARIAKSYKGHFRLARSGWDEESKVNRIVGRSVEQIGGEKGSKISAWWGSVKDRGGVRSTVFPTMGLGAASLVAQIPGINMLAGVVGAAFAINGFMPGGSTNGKKDRHRVNVATDEAEEALSIEFSPRYAQAKRRANNEEERRLTNNRAGIATSITGNAQRPFDLEAQVGERRVEMGRVSSSTPAPSGSAASEASRRLEGHRGEPTHYADEHRIGIAR